jgi:hypothetical protein
MVSVLHSNCRLLKKHKKSFQQQQRIEVKNAVPVPESTYLAAFMKKYNQTMFNYMHVFLTLTVISHTITHHSLTLKVYQDYLKHLALKSGKNIRIE